jgi:hypothetical protein
MDGHTDKVWALDGWQKTDIAIANNDDVDV